MAATDESLLLSLPFEIRQFIFIEHYRDITVVVRTFRQTSAPPDKASARALALMHTCRQLLIEASPIFYDHVTFRFRCRHHWGGREETHDDNYCHVETSQGLHQMSIPIECLDLLGYKFRDPKALTVKQPFEQVKHLRVVADLAKSFFNLGLTLNLAWNTPDADIYRAFIDVLGGKWQLSFRLHLTDPTFGHPLSLEIDNFEQSEAWRCYGEGSDLYFEYIWLIVRSLGLSRDETSAMFARSGIDYHYREVDEN